MNCLSLTDGDIFSKPLFVTISFYQQQEIGDKRKLDALKPLSSAGGHILGMSVGANKKVVKGGTTSLKVGLTG